MSLAFDRYGVMTVATVRPDGWPQATMVGYANDMSTSSSLQAKPDSRDPRVSIAIGGGTRDPWAIEGLSMSARARVLERAADREHAFQKLLLRHPEFAALPRLNDTAAVIEARPEHIAILNYAKGFGRADLVTVGVGGLVTMDPARVDDWGWTPASPG